MKYADDGQVRGLMGAVAALEKELGVVRERLAEMTKRLADLESEERRELSAGLKEIGGPLSGPRPQVLDPRKTGWRKD